MTFRVADARELPFPDASFDVCCVSFGLHEMPVSVRQQALLDMARVTKKNGKLVIVDYALPENPIASKLVYHLVKLYERDHYAEFVRADMHAMLGRAGLAATGEARLVPGAAMRWWSPVMIVIASKVEASNSNSGDVVTG